MARLERVSDVTMVVIVHLALFAKDASELVMRKNVATMKAPLRVSTSACLHLELSGRRCGSNLHVALLDGSMTGFWLMVRVVSHRWQSAVLSTAIFGRDLWRVPSGCGSSDAIGTGPLMAACRRSVCIVWGMCVWVIPQLQPCTCIQS